MSNEYDWNELGERMGWDAIRRRFNEVAFEQGEWAGVPIPVGDHRVVVASERQSFAHIWPRRAPGGESEWQNSWRRDQSYSVYLWREDGRTRGYPLNYWGARIDAMFATLSASRAILPDAEMAAFVTLLGHLSDTQARDYVVSNMFVERGRSQLLYVFRRGLPILTFRASEEEISPRAALCLHPLAYYAHSHAGAMPPSDEILALLLMLRADEPFLWRKANQLDIRDPLVAL